MKMITIIVSPTGTTTLRTEGFAGNECQQASRALEQALGSSLREQLTAEYYQQASASNPQQARADGGTGPAAG